MWKREDVVATAVLVPILLALLAVTSRVSSAAEDQAPGDGNLVVAAAGDAMGEEPAQWAERGAKTCLQCHDTPEVTGILHRAHAQTGDSRTPFAAHQCETCHGASPQHVMRPPEGQKRKPPTITFGMNASTPVDKQNAVCLGCHENRARMHWRGSPHQFAGLSCATCHNPHEMTSALNTSEGQQKTCFQCHTEIRAQIYKRSHHPVREGLISCSDCHNPHGSMTHAMLVGSTVNQTCYKCHEEKRGPFLWEHEPVREDCTICHTPHGSTQVSLLETRGPWLCQRCHSAQFHPSTLYDGNSIVEMDHHVIANNCLNCHPRIHGSNHPSGARFTR